ncbi:MAG TPA: SRPBCC family protein [Nocardioides sp.]|nr:SRPBCC family protein [Nocardioides sp.]
MSSPYLLSSSTVVGATPEAAFDGVLAAPLPELFVERSGPIPPIRECTGQEGAWGDVGQTRTVVLADGGRNLETLVAADRPGSYRYRLTDFSGPMKALVRSIDGEFAFAAEGNGTRVTWSWEMHAANPVARRLLPVMGFFWRRYADKMWPRYAARLPA